MYVCMYVCMYVPFQSSRNCFKYSEEQIGFSHGNLYNLHLLPNSSPAKTWLSTRNRFSLSHRYHCHGRSSFESKDPRFRLLEIEANAVIYIRPKYLIWAWLSQATQISLLQSLVALCRSVEVKNPILRKVTVCNPKNCGEKLCESCQVDWINQEVPGLGLS